MTFQSHNLLFKSHQWVALIIDTVQQEILYLLFQTCIDRAQRNEMSECRLQHCAEHHPHLHEHGGEKYPFWDFISDYMTEFGLVYTIQAVMCRTGDIPCSKSYRWGAENMPQEIVFVCPFLPLVVSRVTTSMTNNWLVGSTCAQGCLIVTI